jgi:hypothetical protein
VVWVSGDHRRALRVFVADGSDGGWTELTTGRGTPIRARAPDLQCAQRLRSRIRAAAALGGDDPDGIAVILDIDVVLAADFRSARCAFVAAADASRLREQPTMATVRYAGPTGGLVGLIADIFMAGVADGVTLIPGAGQHMGNWTADVLARLSHRLPVAPAA